MSFINQRNKLKYITDAVTDNEILIDRLETKDLIHKPITLNKINQEIILANRELITLGEKWESTYQFTNFNTDYIHFLKPHAVLSTESAYDFSGTNVTPYSYTIWEEYKMVDSGIFINVLILKVRADASLIYQTSPTLYAPVYITLKIIVYNNQLFQHFVIHK